MSKHPSTIVVFMAAVVGTVLAALVLNTVVVAVPAGPLPQLVPRQDPGPSLDGGIPGLQAPGGPVFDCTGASEKYTRLGSGLAVQEEAIRRQKEYVAELNRVARDGSKEAYEKTREFAKDQLMDEAKDLAKEAITLRNKVQALKAAGLNQEERKLVLEKVQEIEETYSNMEKDSKNQQASAQYRQALQNSGHNLMAQANALAKLMVDSGLAEQGAALLGPEGPVALKGTLFLIDYTAADYEGFDALSQLQSANSNLLTMQHAYNDIQDKMSDLQKNCLNKPAPPPNPPDSTNLVAPPAANSSHSGAILLFGGLGAAGAVAYAAGVAMKNQQQQSSSGGGTAGHCVNDAPTNACGNCSSSNDCGGADCWTSGSVPPFCG